MRHYLKHEIFLAIFIYVLWVLAYAYFESANEKKILYQSIDQRLETAARVTTQLLPDNYHHQGMVESDWSKKTYDKKMLKLSEFTDNNDVKYVYTLIQRDNKVIFTSSSATPEERTSGNGLTYFFDHYDDVDPRVYDAFSSREKLFLEYEDQWGHFRSVFIPQYSADGMLFISAADISISHIQTLLNQRLYRTLIISFLFLVFAYPIYLAFIQGSKRTAQNLKNRILQQNSALVLSEQRLAYALKASHQGWFDMNPQTGTITVDDAYARMLGYEPAEFNSDVKTWLGLNNIHPDDLAEVTAIFEQMQITEGSVSFEYRRRAKDGQWIWLQTTGEVVERDADNNAIRIIGINADITERKQSEQVLRLLAESGGIGGETIFQLIVKQLAYSQDVRYAFLSRLSSTIDHQVDVVAGWVGDKYSGNFSYSLADTPCEEVVKQDLCSFPDNVQELFPQDHVLVEMGVVSYQGVALKNGDNEVIGLLSLMDEKPMINSVQTTRLLQTLAVRAAIELERIESNEKLQLAARVFADSHEAIFLADINANVIDINPMFTSITGYEREDILGQNLSILNSGKQSAEFYSEMCEQIRAEGFWHGEVSNRKKNGELYIELLTLSTLNDDNGNVLHYLGMFSDITQSKDQQNRLELMAHYDVLTKLPNRTLFADRFAQAVLHSKYNDTLLAVCFLDLDDFKPVNDQYGHEVGDLLLVEVSKRIKAVIREEDTVSRQGGDEFALLLMDLESIAECEPLLQRLHQSLAEPYIINEETIIIGASSGVTVYPLDNGDIDTLLRHADQAMYQAKLLGKNQHSIFNAEHDQQTIQKQNQLQEIQQALSNDEFTLYYQPKVNMKTGKIFGVEALVRWLHPEKGLIPPMDFLPLVDGTYLEIQIGDWVINQALHQMSLWQEQAIDLEVSINVSSYHLQNDHFFDQLSNALSNVPKVHSTRFQLEILESSVLGDLHTISRIIKHCRDSLGIKAALDDFGTGYSSLTHLRSLATDTIKIDRSFVRDMLDDPSDYAIIDGVIGLAESFNREVIAEGIETTEHGLMLLIMGCYKGQGYGIARPMPASQIADWLSSYSPNQQWLDIAKQSFTEKEKQLHLFKLAAHQWKNWFEKNIALMSKETQLWPVMKKTKCPCGTWIQRAKQTLIFDDEWLFKFEQVHDDIHHIANDLLVKYLKGERKDAVLGLAEFNTRFDHLCELIYTEINK